MKIVKYAAGLLVLAALIFYGVHAAAPSQEDGTPPVSIDYAGEELLSQEGTYDLFVEDDSEFRVDVLFTTTETVTDVQFVELCLDEITEDGITSHVGQVYYQADELTPQRPLVIGTVFGEVVPWRGIVYTDAQGTTHQYSLNMSGEDGSLFLLPF